MAISLPVESINPIELLGTTLAEAGHLQLAKIADPKSTQVLRAYVHHLELIIARDYSGLDAETVDLMFPILVGILKIHLSMVERIEGGRASPRPPRPLVQRMRKNIESLELLVEDFNDSRSMREDLKSFEDALSREQ